MDHLMSGLEELLTSESLSIKSTQWKVPNKNDYLCYLCLAHPFQREISFESIKKYWQLVPTYSWDFRISLDWRMLFSVAERSHLIPISAG